MKYKITLNSKTYEVEVVEGEATLLNEYEAVANTVKKEETVVANNAQAQENNTITSKGNSFNSPLPGSVLKVNVSAGQKVKKGEVILVIESMKMENDVCIDKDGTITNVLVSKGTQVAVGTPLVEIA